MKYPLCALILATFILPARAQEGNPCEDTVYLHLARMVVDGSELNETERATYERKDAACIRYQERGNNPAAAPGSADEMLLGVADGRQDAENKSVGGSFVGGLAGGLLAGLIGTGIAYAVQSEPDIESEQNAILLQRSPEYRVGYTDAYKEGVVKRKRSQALVGGLVGTGVLVGIILVASSGN